MHKLSKDTVRLLSSSQAITSLHGVVKELVENSLDARATNVEVKLENYGLDVIEVRDNGSGVSRENAPYMALPHFTSKLASFEDLSALESYGFRGEALASIASVGILQITTCTAEDGVASVYSFNHSGEIIATKPSAMGPGTLVQVSSLFKNVPVRRQYFRSVRRCREDLKKVEDVMLAFGIAHPNVRFVLKHGKCVLWQKIRISEFSANLAVVLGLPVTQHLTEISSHSFNPMIKIRGFVPSSHADTSLTSRTTPDRTFLIVNDRPVTIKPLTQLLRQSSVEAFPSLAGRYPVAVICIDVPPASLDVNLDPNKTTVMLTDLEFISTTLSSLLSQLYSASGAEEEEVEVEEKEEKEKEEEEREGEERENNEDTLSGSVAERESHCNTHNEIEDVIAGPVSSSKAPHVEPGTAWAPPASAPLSPSGTEPTAVELVREASHFLPPEREGASTTAQNGCHDTASEPSPESAVCWDREAGSVCATEEGAGLTTTDPPPASLLQWSRGELLQDAHNRPVEPVQVLQASKGRGLSHSTPPQPKTTHSRSLYPKPSPVHDMINSQPVKRRTESPHARTAPPLKRRKEGTPYPGGNTASRGQPQLMFEPVVTSREASRVLPFSLRLVTERARSSKRNCKPPLEDCVVGHCSPPGVWLVLWNTHIACFCTARVLEGQSSRASMSSIKTLFNHTLSTASDVTLHSHFHTIFTLEHDP